MAEAAAALPYMSKNEHAQVHRLVSILFLGFLLPHSTGNEFFLLQNLSSSSRAANHIMFQTAGSQTTENNHDNMGQQYVLSMPLLERLESIPHKYNPDDFGEFDCILHEQMDQAFLKFILNLEPFLSSRHAPTKEVDLLHLLAMAIHPNPSSEHNNMEKTTQQLEESEVWKYTKRRLMSSLVPHNFHVTYRHRLRLVQLVTDCLVLPEYKKTTSATDAPLFEGALPHLRASLYAFGVAAMGPRDAHWAQCGLVSVSIQSGIDLVIREEWDRLCHRLVDDRTDYHCCHDSNYCSSNSFSLMNTTMTTHQPFCPRRARGELLERFLKTYNEARQYADTKFLKHALGSLTEFIEWQEYCWTNPSEEDDGGEESTDKEDSSTDGEGGEEEEESKEEDKEEKNDGESTKEESTEKGGGGDEQGRIDEQGSKNAGKEGSTEDETNENDRSTKKESTEQEGGGDKESTEKESNGGEKTNERADDKEKQKMKESTNKDEDDGKEKESGGDEKYTEEDNKRDANQSTKREKIDHRNKNDERVEIGEEKADGEKMDCSNDDIEKEDDGDKETSCEGENDDCIKNALQTTFYPPCLLSSLLFAARPLFYFLLPILNVDNKRGTESEESRHRDMLISCSIQLLHHWDTVVALQASQLLVLAFCYGPDDMISDYVGAIFESTKLALQEALKNKQNDNAVRRQIAVPIEGVLTLGAQKSAVYADSLLMLLLSPDQHKIWKLNEGCNDRDEVVFRLVASIATASPVAAVKHSDKLVQYIESSKTTPDSRKHLTSALLTCRRARFFVQKNQIVEKCILKLASDDSLSGWDLYLLARHAMVTGNFGIAKTMYQRLETLASSDSSYVWLSVLVNVAEADESLSLSAAKGIPFATTQLRSAASALHSLSFLTQSPNVSFSFQSKLLNLRLDLLDTLAGIRQLTREMRLTGVGPKKNTRPSLHLRNAVKCLNVLATKYLTIYRQHGLFICQQSRTSLRTLHALCRFVASAARSTFIDELPETSIDDFQKNAIEALTLPKGDASHPLTILMKRLDSSVLKDIDISLDAKIRAAAMLEILDGVLKAPSPFPSAFTITKSLPRASVKLSGDPDSVEIMEEHGDIGFECDEEIEVSRGTGFTFFASGCIPATMLSVSQLPFCIVLLWHTVSHRESANDDEDKPDDENMSSSDFKSTSSVMDILGGEDPAPAASSLSCNGRFFMKIECQPILQEGVYGIETRLGCRDIRGGEWELPLKGGTHSITVRVSRSRS